MRAHELPVRLLPVTGEPTGFALPAALLALLAVSLLVAAAFDAAGLEDAASRAHESSVRAALVAESGLVTFLATGGSTPPANARIEIEDGSATLSGRRVLATADGGELWAVTAEGTSGGAVCRLRVLVVRSPAGRLRVWPGSVREAS